LLAARADDSRIMSQADLRGATVGYFRSNLVMRTLHALGAGELKVFDVEEGLFQALRDGDLDAVVYDSPAVRWRAAQDPTLRVVGEPLNRLSYNVAVRREDRELFGKVQAAVQDIVTSGESQRIQQQWEQAQDTPNE
jgi:polar amino acid transport system substrate-binding protein